jgi:hypothetical protein
MPDFGHLLLQLHLSPYAVIYAMLVHGHQEAFLIAIVVGRDHGLPLLWPRLVFLAMLGFGLPFGVRHLNLHAITFATQVHGLIAVPDTVLIAMRDRGRLQ